MKIIECKEKITENRNRIQEIIDLAKEEIRDLTENEEKEIEALRGEIDEKKEEIKELQDELDKQVPDEEHEEEETEEKEDENKNKNIRSSKMKKLSLVSEIRNAIAENKKSFIINAERRADPTVTAAGVHDAVIETQIEGILEPLYANSVLAKLGARWYTGLPMGDVQIPIMDKSTVLWEGEVDQAQATSHTFTTVKLSPKRLSAYIDISKQLIAQDTIGVEDAIRRDLVNALNDKLEATLFGGEDATTEQPAGLFYNKELVHVADFPALCQFEAAVEENNVYGNMKYVLSPAAKADFRSMIKGTNATGMVYENSEMDGIESYVTTNVETKKFIYGDFSNVVVGNWGNVEIVVDPYTQATKGCIRLIINAYFDFKAVRDGEAFNFGTTAIE